MAYASPAQAELVPGWRDCNRSVGDSGNVGVWHEACVSRPDRMHVIYRSMPLFGMAKATEHAHRGGDGLVVAARPPQGRAAA
ncbi:monooxygenase family protein [Streptomyces werraensis]|uniref:monooxygenase family protein n=1 Tax=Streptomyces werraensis TaxID=68284 RepID=UPI00382C1F95